MKTLPEFFHMGGHGPYVWGSVFMCALVIVLELWALGRRRSALVSEAARDEQVREDAPS